MASERAGERPCSLFSTNTRSKDCRYQILGSIQNKELETIKINAKILHYLKDNHRAQFGFWWGREDTPILAKSH